MSFTEDCGKCRNRSGADLDDGPALGTDEVDVGVMRMPERITTLPVGRVQDIQHIHRPKHLERAIDRGNIHDRGERLHSAVDLLHRDVILHVVQHGDDDLALRGYAACRARAGCETGFPGRTSVDLQAVRRQQGFVGENALG